MSLKEPDHSPTVKRRGPESIPWRQPKRDAPIRRDPVHHESDSN